MSIIRRRAVGTPPPAPRILLLGLLGLAALAGCSGRDIADIQEVARARVEPLVFDEGYGDDVYFQAFSGTYLEAVSIDSVSAHESLIYAHDSEKSLRVVVPGADSPLGDYAGGVLTSVAPREFADFNALTLWARSSVISQLDKAGFGDDNTGTSLYSALRLGIPLTANWTFVVLPIPSPRKLVAERGMFTFAEGFEAMNRNGHALWFDDIRYDFLPDVERVGAAMTSVDTQYLIGSTVAIKGTTTTFRIGGDAGTTVVMEHGQAYFDFFSSNPAVAVVEGPRIRVVGAGVDTITAKLEDLDVQGRVVITSFAPPSAPAPSPTLLASDVISLYGDVYENRTVDDFNPEWTYSTTQDQDYAVDGDPCLMYTTLNFVGIVFTSDPIDATGMTHLHLDVYAPQGGVIKVKLVNFGGPGGSMNGQAELTFDATTTPAFGPGAWSQLDIPLADFPFPSGFVLNSLGQLVLSTTGDPLTAAPLLLVDNIYWHR